MANTERRSRDAEGSGVYGGTVAVEKDLRRIAHMFSPHRTDPLMRELCRLAIKCAQERLISG